MSLPLCWSCFGSNNQMDPKLLKCPFSVCHEKLRLTDQVLITSDFVCSFSALISHPNDVIWCAIFTSNIKTTHVVSPYLFNKNFKKKHVFRSSPRSVTIIPWSHAEVSAGCVNQILKSCTCATHHLPAKIPRFSKERKSTSIVGLKDHHMICRKCITCIYIYMRIYIYII